VRRDAEPPYDPVPVLRAFAEEDVDFVVIGGVAGGYHGSNYGTRDIDLAYSRDRDNLERIAAVLRALGATLRGAPADLPFQLDADSLQEGGNFTFATSLGPIDILAYPAGAPPYDVLRAAADVADVAGLTVRFASLEHLIAMKDAAARPRDKLMAAEYRTIADEQRKPR
jgi:hypothetical protein